jgi:hypothetical protein
MQIVSARRGRPHGLSRQDHLVGYVWGFAGTIVAVLAGFWLALRQDKVRWSREKRADLYIDLLTEAHAELDWIEHELTAEEIRGIPDDPVSGAEAEAEWRAEAASAYRDTRLPARERAILGARSNVYASREVMRRFNAVTACFPLVRDPFMAPALKMNARMAFDKLQEQIRSELKATD